MDVANTISAKTVSPNPFSETTTFAFPEAGNYHLKIFDITGKQVDESTFSGREYIYQSAKIPHGVYYYEISFNSSEEKKTSSSFARGILIKH